MGTFIGLADCFPHADVEGIAVRHSLALHDGLHDVFVLVEEEEGLFLGGEGGLGHEGDAAVGKRHDRGHLPREYLRSDLFDVDWIV